MLQTIINQSLLLSPEQKTKLLATLPSLSPDQAKELESLLRSEDHVMAGLVNATIERATESGDEHFLRELDAFLLTANHTLNRTAEGEEREEDMRKADDLFSQLP